MPWNRENADVKRAVMMSFKFKWFSVLEVSWVLLVLYGYSRQPADYGDTVERVDSYSYLLDQMESDAIVIANSSSDYEDWVSHPAPPGAYYLDSMERDVIGISMPSTMNYCNCEFHATLASTCTRVECSKRALNSSCLLAPNNTKRVHSGSGGNNGSDLILRMLDYRRSYIRIPLPAEPVPADNNLTIIIWRGYADSNISFQSIFVDLYFRSISGTWRAFPGSQEPPFNPTSRPWYWAGFPVLKKLSMLMDSGDCKRTFEKVSSKSPDAIHVNLAKTIHFTVTYPIFDPRDRAWYMVAPPIKQLKILIDCGSFMFNVVKPAFGRSEGTTYLNVGQEILSEFLKALAPEDLVNVFSFNSNGANFVYKQVTQGDQPKRPSSWSNIIIADNPADVGRSNLHAAIHDVIPTFQLNTLSLKVILVFSDGNFEPFRLEPNLLADSQVRFMFYMLPDNFDSDPRELSALKSALFDSNNHFEVLDIASLMSPLYWIQGYFSFLEYTRFASTPEKYTRNAFVGISGDAIPAVATSSGANDEHFKAKTYDECSQLASKLHAPYNPKDLTFHPFSKQVYSAFLEKISTGFSEVRDVACCWSCLTPVGPSAEHDPQQAIYEKFLNITSVTTAMLCLITILLILLFNEKLSVYLFFYKPRISDSNYILNVPIVIEKIIKKVEFVSTLIEEPSRKPPRKSSELHFMYQCVALKIVLITVKNYLEKDAFKFRRIQSKYDYVKHNKEFEDVCLRFSREMEVLLRRAELLLRNCCKSDNQFWIRNVIIQTVSHEDFIDITSSFEWCLNVLHHHLRAVSDKSWIGICPPKWLPITKTDIDKDLSKLQKSLASFIRNTPGGDSNFELACYLYTWRSIVSNSSDRTSLSEMDEHVLMQAPSFQKLEQTLVLGEGSNGNVYKVRWLGVDCAMKVFKDHAMDHRKKELGTLAKHCHPHIVKLFCCSGGPAIIMEVMKEDLYTFVRNLRAKKRNLPLEDALEIMLQIAKGMAFLHNHGIAHRDLKSSNIFLNYEGQFEDLRSNFQVLAKVGDFGLAMSFDLSNPQGFCLKPGENFGSRLWKAPESFPQNQSGSEIMLKPLDVYGFGIICSEIITGKVPFQDVKPMCAADFADYVQVGHRPDLPSSDRCPERLAELIRDCWQTHPSSRPEFDDICTRLLDLKSSWILDGNVTVGMDATL